MTRSEQYRCSGFTRLAGIAGLLILLVTAIAAPAQTFTVLHDFTGSDGGNPGRALLIDGSGNLYGVAGNAGNYDTNCQPYGCGTAFELKREQSGWIFNLLYTFLGGYDGLRPDSSLVFGPDGALYGSLAQGGVGRCGDSGSLTCGMIYRLAPPANFCGNVLCSWNQTVLYRFTGLSDGGVPEQISFDQAGNIYGPTELGGQDNGCSGYYCGTVFKLSPSGGGWTESVLYAFLGGSRDGYWPDSNLVFDQGSNIYGTTIMGGYTYEGTVYQLTPYGSGYSEQMIYQFNDGDSGQGPTGLISDAAGNLYGTTFTGGSGGSGTVFELSPSNGSWIFSVLYSFSGTSGSGPSAGVVMDAAGNLYGTTNRTGGDNRGVVFKLTRSGSAWIYSSLHDFTGGADGANPGALVLDGNGNIFGVSAAGGHGSCGVGGCGAVWEITP
ncbi:MAG: choice-of-anchor tandem repeat GloVer-containing protein [Candidatus Korobacteraceae bacterium]|jgi:uncharacterized repeat protein (TIGR03803 family)